ncbi:MAG TPA: response regulator transcription factor [Candidatus Limnocylindrales bacterium]
MVSVIIADDHAVVRQGVARILSGTRDVTVVGEAASGDELIDRLLSTNADVCLLDLAMPGGGLDALGRLHELRPDLRILVFSMHPEDQFAVRCLAAGASGYLGKGCPPEQLVSALRTVAAGRRYIGETVAELLADHVVSGPQGEPHEKLSNREYEVFRRLARGESSGEIANTLGLSVKSVSTYRTRVLEKLGLSRNADLTRYAIRHGLID